MNFIQKWIHNYRWKNFDKKLFNEIVMIFLKNGYAVDIPYDNRRTVRLDLHVVKDNREVYFRFMQGGLIGFGCINTLCKFADTTKKKLIVVVDEDISVFERNVFNDYNVDVVVAPTPEELCKAVRKSKCVG